MSFDHVCFGLTAVSHATATAKAGGQDAAVPQGGSEPKLPIFCGAAKDRLREKLQSYSGSHVQWLPFAMERYAATQLPFSEFWIALRGSEKLSL
ncbi:hypothetical protein [uncultured Sulfitobacter sp.]|uniref:hypothetical protein n=1 Tax=uncultured Sulfitobacter sp. TaxID=191468 RepID=UPI0030DCD1C1|tara:strand:+ start:9661 stop:9942 length:282 start_codon:yes stop_codon:yes gene_type:complete